MWEKWASKLNLDSIAVSVFVIIGWVGQILILDSIRSQDPNNSSDTERGPCLVVPYTMFVGSTGRGDWILGNQGGASRNVSSNGIKQKWPTHHQGSLFGCERPSEKISAKKGCSPACSYQQWSNTRSFTRNIQGKVERLNTVGATTVTLHPTKIWIV